MAHALRALNENWKVSLLLLIPLFYRTVRTFLERVEKAWGIEAPRTQRPEIKMATQENPPPKPVPSDTEEGDS